MGKKINWKKILLIGGGAYVVITMLSVAIGGAVMLNKKAAMDNRTDKLGMEFEEKKADFQESFKKNWNDHLDKMSKGFAKSEKRNDRFLMELNENSIKYCKKILENHGGEKMPAEEKAALEEELLEFSKHVATKKMAYKKKWGKIQEEEPQEEYDKRTDEGKIDWIQEQLNFANLSMKWAETDKAIEKKEDWIEDLINSLEYQQSRFKEKWGEEYPGTSDGFKKQKAVAQEEGRKDCEKFLSDLAAKRAEEEKERDRTWMASISERNSNNETCVDNNPYHPRKTLTLRGVRSGYLDLVVADGAFNKKWDPRRADETQEEYDKRKDEGRLYFTHLKLERLQDKFDNNRCVGRGETPKKLKEDKEALAKGVEDFQRKWKTEKIPLPCGHGYLKNLLEVEARIVMNETAEEKHILEEFEKIVVSEEENLKELNKIMCIPLGQRDRAKEASERMEKLQLRPLLKRFQSAFNKKWDLRGDDESQEEYEKRRDEGHLEILVARMELIDKEEHFGTGWLKDYIGKTLKNEQQYFTKKWLENPPAPFDAFEKQKASLAVEMPGREFSIEYTAEIPYYRRVYSGMSEVKSY